MLKAWLPERNWLVGNRVKFSHWHEEKEYQRCLKSLRLMERIEMVQLTRIVDQIVVTNAHKKAIQTKVEKRVQDKNRL